MNKSLKAGIWYTASNFINKGIAYLSTPVFTRLMTKDEIGQFGNFTSWATLLLIITSLDLYSSINRAYFDYEEDFDEYMSSISAISLVFTAIVYLIVYIFRERAVVFLNMDIRYINLLFLYLLFYPAYNFFMMQQRICQKYKLFSFVSIGSSLLIMFVSVVLVVGMKDRLLGRVIGYVLPMAVIDIIIFGVFFYRGRKIVLEKIKYALLISIPLIPHHISNNIMSSADRIMITKFCGPERNALYTIAYSCVLLVTLLHTSINQAYVPWLYNKLHIKRHEGIQKNSEMLIYLFLFLILGALLIAPELLLIMGGENYLEAVYVMPLAMLGCCFQFIYTLYVNLEFYCKKTFTVSIGTLVAALFNIVANTLLIPSFGYIAAAFTTLLSYILLYFIHWIAVRKLEYYSLYNNRKICIIMLMYCLIIVPIFWLYNQFIIRICVLIVYMLIFIIVSLKIYKKRSFFIGDSE